MPSFRGGEVCNFAQRFSPQTTKVMNVERAYGRFVRWQAQNARRNEHTKNLDSGRFAGVSSELDLLGRHLDVARRLPDKRYLCWRDREHRKYEGRVRSGASLQHQPDQL